ncbi:MAG: IS30 family transposase [Chloroflexi bacterium]|nr:IS30 family transposase [Chloroflexota bacterium]
MGKDHHKKLSPEERDRIALMRGRGESIRNIAVFIGRSASTISDELKRNSLNSGEYVAIHAQGRANERKARGRKRHPLKNETVYAYVIEKLREGWSPEQIAGRLKKENGETVICHETIYRFIYSEQGKKMGLSEYLPCKRTKRRRKRGRKVHRSRIPDRVSIRERPIEASSRVEFGHWEGDTVEGRGHKDGIHTEVERVSRLTLAVKVKQVSSELTIEAQKAMFAPLPAEARKSTTLDNGRENHRHMELAELGMTTYFADPYSSWQRGSNEYHNGLLRRYLPKGSSFEDLDNDELADIVSEINDRPRKVLGFNTPQEVYNRCLGVRIPL